MLYGMGTVFVFLTTLIVTTLLMSSVIARFFGTAAPQSTAAFEAQPSSTANTNQPDPSLLRVLQAAVDAHKK